MYTFLTTPQSVLTLSMLHGDRLLRGGVEGYGVA